MSEENTTQAPGLVLPDDAAAADRVTATDRLLSFDAGGNPVTATASQLREYAAAGLATTESMTAALSGKFDKTGGDVEGEMGVKGNTAYRDGGRTLFGRDKNGAFINSTDASGETTAQLRMWNDGKITFWKPSFGNDQFVDVWHGGNFVPEDCMQNKGMSVDISQEMIGTGFQYDTGGSGTTGPFLSAGSPKYPLQVVCGYWAGNGGHQNLKFRTRNGDTGVWNPWFTLYSTGNLSPATAASVGLMSAEDKIKLNSVASAMSLTVQTADTPATLSLTDAASPENAVTPEISIRAQRAAQYQMQADELLYDALEAFARNHPEHSEFAAWLTAKNRIRTELPKPQEGGTNE